MMYGKMIGLGVIVLLSGVAGCSSCSTVDAGEVGLYNRYGQIDEQVAKPGLHFLNPLTTSIEKMTVQAQRWDAKTPVYTQDLQTADVSFALTYSLRPEAAARMRRTVGTEWSGRLIPPIVQSSIKNVFAQYTAMNAVAKRPVLQQRITAVVRERLALRGITVDAFELTNLDYSDAFENAVEQAQVATQRAVAARNQTVTIQEQAKQAVIAAQGRAKATQLEANAISTNPSIVEMRAVEKWNGVLPRNMYGSAPLPFINGAR